MSQDKTPERPVLDSENPERDSSHMNPGAALPVTDRQMRVLVAIEQFLDSRGYPPTVRALCDMLEMSSTNGMLEHLRALERKGYIERDRGEARGIRVVVASKGARLAPPLAKGHACSKCGSRVA